MKRRIFNAITVVVFFLALLGGPSIAPKDHSVIAQTGTNLALGKTAVASTQQSGHAPLSATDGSISTYWASSFAEPAWIYVDLGTSQAVSQVILIWDGTYGSKYRIEGSNTITGWTELAQETNGDGGNDYIAISGSWRYIRLYATQRATGYGFGLIEFQIYDIAQPVLPSDPVIPQLPPKPTSQTLFSDDFSSGNLNQWQIERGSWNVVNGALNSSYPCAGGDPYIISAGDTSWTDYQLTIDIRRLAGWDYGGILFRKSAYGYYRLEINPSLPYGGFARLSRSDTGQLAARSWPFIPNTWSRLVIDVEGPSIDIYILDDAQNPIPLISYTDLNGPFLAGNIGLGLAAGAVCPTQMDYDNVFIRQIAPSYLASGIIKDPAGNALKYVTVSVDGTNITTLTKPDGSFTLGRLPQGSHTIRPIKRGMVFEPAQRSVSLGPSVSGLSFEGDFTQWTLMYYLDGDNNLGNTYPPIFNQLEKGAGNRYVNVVAVYDAPGGNNTSYYQVLPDQDEGHFASYEEGVNTWKVGELNMGDGGTLRSFIEWAQERYPARHFALILDDHGSGLGGGMLDDNSAGDHIEIPEMSSAIQAAVQKGQKIDILVMNACLMGMLEDAYQFRSSIDYYVASEDIQWAYSTGYYEVLRSTTRTTTPSALANQFVMAYANEMDGRQSYTMASGDISKLEGLVTATNHLAEVLNTNLSANASTISRALFGVQRFDKNGDSKINHEDPYIDLYDFAQRVQNEAEDTAIDSAAQEVMAAVLAYIPPSNERHAQGMAVNGSHGVSVFFPDHNSSFYNPSRYDFAVGATWGTGSQVNGFSPLLAASSNTWGGLISNYVFETNPTSPDDSTPPDPIEKAIFYSVFLPVLTR